MNYNMYPIKVYVFIEYFYEKYKYILQKAIRI